MKTVAGFRRHLVAGGTVAQSDNRRGPGRPWAELGLHGSHGKCSLASQSNTDNTTCKAPSRVPARRDSGGPPGQQSEGKTSGQEKD